MRKWHEVSFLVPYTVILTGSCFGMHFSKWNLWRDPITNQVSCWIPDIADNGSLVIVGFSTVWI